MANLISVSSKDLGRRRHQLRRQRRLKIVQVMWQALTLSGLTGGLLWAINQPIWFIRQSEQIEVKGNRLLSDQMVRSFLPLSYPQSLWKIQPQILEKSLESRSQIADAYVERQMFPPSLTITIQERESVAIAYSVPKEDQGNPNPEIGWLDATGNWMPLENYQELEKTQQLPDLKVTGNVANYRMYWSQVYQAISRSPLKILAINWADPNNLILETEIGQVHLGPYTSKFPEQLRVIDQMRNLPNQLDTSKMLYFDLKNPEQPLAQMKPEAVSQSSPEED